MARTMGVHDNDRGKAGARFYFILSSVSNAGDVGVGGSWSPLPLKTEQLFPFIEAIFISFEKFQMNQTILPTDNNAAAR